MNDDMVFGLRNNLVSELDGTPASGTKARRMTVPEMVAAILRPSSAKSMSEPVAPLAREVLERVGMGDVADSHDERSRAVKSALDAPSERGMPPLISGWLNGEDQPPPDPEEATRREAKQRALAEHFRAVANAKPPKPVEDAGHTMSGVGLSGILAERQHRQY